MSNLKLCVEVISAHDLFPRDRPNSCNPFVVLKFDNQSFHTTTKHSDLNPFWNESFFFAVSDPTVLSNLTLEAHVYGHHSQSDNAKSFLGKVRVSGTSFVTRSEASLLYYPLEKRSVFSRARGELGLKVFITDNPSPKSETFRSFGSIPPSETIKPEATVVVKEKTRAFRVFGSTPSSETIKPDVTADVKEKTRTFRKLSPTQKQQQVTFHNIKPSDKQQPVKFGMHEMRSAPLPPKVVQMNSPGGPSDFSVKETSPSLGGGWIIGGRVVRGSERPASGIYDLVEEMKFLYVRVVKARELPAMDVTGGLDPYVVVKVGNFRGVTKHFEKRNNPEWNQVFAFAKEHLQSNTLEVVVKDKDILLDDFVGIVRFDFREVPDRVPPDSPLAPEWYRLEDKKGEKKKKSEIMLAVWFGTQADEAFAEAVFSDTFNSSDSSSILSTNVRSKVYHSPRLWYLRVRVLEAQDLVVSEKGRVPEVFVKIQTGNKMFKTKISQSRTLNPKWNEEFLFVVAEPFEDHLVVSVEDHVSPNKDESLGNAVLPLKDVERRTDDRQMRGRWLHLEDSLSDAMDEDKARKVKFATRLHLAAVLDGGYHVLDESTYYSSDLRPTARPLWKSAIGVLELGILSANGLHAMKTRDGRGTSDTYVVAKYLNKWVRTRTVVNSLSPKYNEQYTWEVYDPATVLTIGVFDNANIGTSNGNNSRDKTIGKVRIRLSTLQTGHVYTHTYPLLVLEASGLKKMGELHLAVRFTCTSVSNMLMKYTKPLLPKMHYVQPLSVLQQENLREQAMRIVWARLGRAEPPLRKEVVEFMTDARAHLFSVRRSKANFFRLTGVFSGVISVGKWMGHVRTWRNPVTTVLVHVLYTMLVMFPGMIFPTVFLYMAVIGLWNYRFRPRYPPHMNARISHADIASADELDEEFDSYPTTKSSDAVRMRYDRLRVVAGKVQTVAGDIAAQGERVQALLSWRDPRATAIFVSFCLVAAIVLYVTPFQLVALLTGFYSMRHPKFRRRIPSPPLNFFRRLPAMTDSLL